MTSTPQSLRVLSLTPGRVRVHLPGWAEGDRETIEAGLCVVNGVRSVQANPLTRNVLIQFDVRATNDKTLLADIQEAWDKLPITRQPEQAARPIAPIVQGMRHLANSQASSQSLVLRAGLRGLLGHAAVDSLWFGAGFLGKVLGLPTTGLGPLHVLMDVAVWGMALRSTSRHSASALTVRTGP